MKAVESTRKRSKTVEKVPHGTPFWLAKNDRVPTPRNANTTSPFISTGGGAPLPRRPRTAEAQTLRRARKIAIIFRDFPFCTCHIWHGPGAPPQIFCVVLQAENHPPLPPGEAG